jgi:hypothetical protein
MAIVEDGALGRGNGIDKKWEGIYKKNAPPRLREEVKFSLLGTF